MSNAVSVVRRCALAALFVVGIGSVGAVGADQSGGEESWLPSLTTETPEEGFELAIKLSQKGVARTQPDASVRHQLRGGYSRDADSLTRASHVIAVHFQTIAEANNHWKE